MAKLSFATHTQVLNTPLLFNHLTIHNITTILLFIYFCTTTSSIPITTSDTENYLPSDDPNITNLMVSHYDCTKQHNLRQFNLLNVKQCTEAPSDIKHASVKARVFVRAKLNELMLLNALPTQRKKEKFVFKIRSNTVVLTELYGTIIHYHFLLHLIHLNAKISYDTLMVQKIKY